MYSITSFIFVASNDLVATNYLKYWRKKKIKKNAVHLWETIGNIIYAMTRILSEIKVRLFILILYMLNLLTNF